MRLQIIGRLAVQTSSWDANFFHKWVGLCCSSLGVGPLARIFLSMACRHPPRGTDCHHPSRHGCVPIGADGRLTELSHCLFQLGAPSLTSYRSGSYKPCIGVVGRFCAASCASCLVSTDSGRGPELFCSSVSSLMPLIHTRLEYLLTYRRCVRIPTR